MGINESVRGGKDPTGGCLEECVKVRCWRGAEYTGGT